jgi:hypothetical protein
VLSHGRPGERSGEGGRVVGGRSGGGKGERTARTGAPRKVHNVKRGERREGESDGETGEWWTGASNVQQN